MRELRGRTPGAFGSRSGHLARLVLIALAAIAAACVADESEAPSSLHELADRSLAAIDGELAVPGLREPVEVIRDEWGVPHIYAQNDDDLFFAQGYAGRGTRRSGRAITPTPGGCSPRTPTA